MDQQFFFSILRTIDDPGLAIFQGGLIDDFISDL
jgi:hypothetical protein